MGKNTKISIFSRPKRYLGFDLLECQRSYQRMATVLFGERQLPPAESSLLPQLQAMSGKTDAEALANELARIEELAQRLRLARTIEGLRQKIYPIHLLAMTAAYRHQGDDCLPSPSLLVFGEALALWKPTFSIEAIVRGEAPMIDQSEVDRFQNVFLELLSSQDHRRDIRERRREADRLRIRYEDYCNTLRWTPRVLVIGLMLTYSPPSIQRSDSAQWRYDLDHFFRNRRHNALFEGYLGYVAELKFSPEAGFHWRLFLFIDGNQRLGANPADLARDIGAYWQDQITEGRGNFRPFNEYPRKPRRNIRPVNLPAIPPRHSEIGVLNKGDNLAWSTLIFGLLSEYCTSSEWIRLNLPKGYRQIRKGIEPADKR